MHSLLEPLPTPTTTAEMVPMALYRRHLGLPACAELDERLEELAGQARDWYRTHGSPWNDARRIGIRQIDGEVTLLEQELELHSALLAEGLAQAKAHELIVVAATAGEAVDRRIDELWKLERPDEAMFLNAYTIAVVEQLRWRAGDHLRRSYCNQGMTVLPYYSPGYEGWDLSDQENLFRIVVGGAVNSPLPMRVLASGGLWPAKSIIAAYGVTERTDIVDERGGYWSRHSNGSVSADRLVPTYAFPLKTLILWRTKRLQLTVQHNHELVARFRFDGSTCNNLGVPIVIDYHVHLERDGEKGYRITRSSCQPADGDVGFRSTCAYLDNPARHVAEIESYQPFVGRSLHEVLTWNPPVSPAGCICNRAGEDHKWRIVLQTIHYALQNHE